jgi:hypothetical protein
VEPTVQLMAFSISSSNLQGEATAVEFAEQITGREVNKFSDVSPANKQTLLKRKLLNNISI